MKYWYHSPHASIAGYVRSIVVLKDSFDSPSSDLPLFTNGLPALLTEITKDKTQLTLFGQSVPGEKWTADDHTTVIAYFFRPFAICPVFNLAAKTLNVQPVELASWNPQKNAAIGQQLLQADTTGRQIEILDNFICSHIENNQKECHIIKYVTDLMMYDPDKDVHARILADLKLTERTFQRIFKKYTGITPNQYRRICQFYFAFAQLRNGNFDTLTDVAYTHGYFDQSHYIRSFKEYTNTTPNEYLNTGLVKKTE